LEVLSDLGRVITAYNNNNNNNNIFGLIARFCKKNPKRAACASLVEREEKGFEVGLKDERERLLSLR